jgi:IclR family acetate operon transcriptional repressor
MGIGEVAEMTGLPQGTAHRLLHSLQSRGYVRQDSSRKYSVGTAALRLGDAAQRSLARNARPHLSDLVAISGETANLAVLEGNDVVYVAQAPSPHTLRMFAEVGRHVPPHSTAVGKVLLAAMPRERALGLLRRTGLPRRTDQTITELGAFARELDTVLNHGWAADEEEQEVGVRCLAVPVGHGEDAVAAISLSGPADRFNGGREPGLVEAMGGSRSVSRTSCSDREPGGANPRTNQRSRSVAIWRPSRRRIGTGSAMHRSRSGCSSVSAYAASIPADRSSSSLS